MGHRSSPFSIKNLDTQIDDETLRQAQALFEHGAVSDLDIEGDWAAASVRDHGLNHEVDISLEDGQAFLTCDCDEYWENGICRHIVAVIMALNQGVSASPAAPLPAAAENRLAARVPLVEPAPGPAEIEADYRQLMAGLTVKQMRDMAASRRIPLSGLKRDAILETMVQHLKRPERLAEAVEQLADDSRRTLDFLSLLAPDVLSFGAAERVLPYLDAALSVGSPARPVGMCLDDLLRAGLVFRGDSARSDRLYIPKQVLAWRGSTPALFKEYSGPLERVDAAQPFQFVRLGMRLVLVGQSGGLEFEKPGRTDPQGWPVQIGGKPSTHEQQIVTQDLCLKAEAAFRIAGVTHEPEEKIDLAARILLASGFWEKGDPRRLGEAFWAWLGLDLGEQSRRLFRTSLGLSAFPELDSASTSAGFTLWRTGWTLLREVFAAGLINDRLRLVGLLARAPSGRWVDVDAILRTLHALQPYWLPELDLRNPGPAYLRATALKYHGKTPDLLDYPAWAQTFGRFYLTILTRTLAWLGLCDLAWQQDALAAIRISDFGDYLLGRRAEYPQVAAAPAGPSLRIEGERKLWLDPDQADAELVNLTLLIGSPQEQKKNSPELSYEVQVSGLGRAFAAGWTPQRIRALLERGSQSPLPAGLAGMLDTVAERYGRLHLYTNVALIEFADDYALPELLANTSLNQVLLYTFSPRLVAVHPDGIERLVDEMRAKGYTPRLEGEAHG